MDINSLVEVNATADIKTERTIAINAIVSDSYCQQLKPLVTDIHLFESTFVRTVIQWALEYHHTYGKCINMHIVGVYEQNRDKLSATVSQDIADFLDSISKEYAESEGLVHNVDFEVSKAEKYLNTQNIKATVKKTEKAMLTGNILKANQTIANHRRITTVDKKSVDITNNFDRYDRAEDDKDFLFNLPGRLGTLWGPIKRKHMSMWGGRRKAGKSRALVKFCAEAWKAGCSVLFVALEMTEDEVARLFDQEILKHYVKGGTAYIPVFRQEGKKAYIGYEERKIEESTKEEMKMYWEANKMFNPDARLYIRTFPQNSMIVNTHLIPEVDLIRAEDGVNFDVVAIDYADLAGDAPEDMRLDERLKIRKRRRDMKKFAQEYNLHLHTATQLNEDNSVKEDKSKEDDTNVLVNMNQTPDEKRKGIYRLNCTANRNVEFNEDRYLTITTNNGIGQFYLDSRWSWEVEDTDEEIGEDFKLFVPNKEYEEEDNDWWEDF